MGKQNPFGILLENMCTLPPGLTWVRSSDGQKVNGAVIGGSEHGGMYVGRAIGRVGGDILPGKVHCEHGVIYVPYGGKEHNFSSYEVLTEVDPSNSSIHWIRSESGRIPPLAVQGGYTSCGEPLYIGKILLSSGVICCGKVHPSHGALYIPYGGKELAFKTGYDILVSRDRRPPQSPSPTMTPTSTITSGSALAPLTTKPEEPHREEPHPEEPHPEEPHPEEPHPEGSLVCQICYENSNGNWGLVHGGTMHAGYCEGCAEKLKRDRLPCPQCRSDIEAVIKVFMN